jgi:two-component system, OmpR family, alkaline phosphatase synthesis response regulator PhoP
VNKEVLIVDDSPTLRKVLNFYLSKRGFSVSEAQNGKIALEQITQKQFDVLILDMSMPVMNGEQVLAALKAKPDFHTPILILSADKIEERKAMGISLGAAYYMTKPFQPNEVVEMINKILDGSQASAT